MDLSLDEDTRQLRRAVAQWVDGRQRVGRTDAFEHRRWTDFAQWGLMDPQDPATMPQRCAGLAEAARAGLPGPVLEAELACAADPTGRAAEAVASGEIVSSVGPGSTGPTLVGWGAAATLVIDQGSGEVLATGPLPRADLSYAVPHGWLDQGRSGPDPLREHRWTVGAALLSGLTQGALELTAAHVRDRRQFGRALASFQAVQFPLAECKVLADGAELCALDAAARLADGHPGAAESAALAWLMSVRAARRATRVCHQSYGALGFCLESGLPDLTWAMSWLRMSVGRRSAQGFLADSRRAALAEARVPESACLVLEGFGVEEAVA